MFGTRIGHAHLLVRDLARSVAFYTRYLGLKLNEQVGDRTAFLSGGGPHHELALSAIGMDASDQDEKSVGLAHLAFDMPDKRAFAQAFRQLTEDGIKVSPVDHKIGWGAYFRDPDGNELELYCDTRAEPDGEPLWGGVNRQLTREKILAAL